MSCVNNVDFNQASDFSLQPVFKSPILFFTLNQFDFLDNSGEVNSVIDVLPFDILENAYLKNGLVKVELEFKINNQFDRNFEVDLQFLDEGGVVTHSFSTFQINSRESNFTREETIIVLDSPQFLSSTRVKVTIKLLPSLDGSSLDPSVNQTLKFESGGTYYLEI